jgi:hypothetical protein
MGVWTLADIMVEKFVLNLHIAMVKVLQVVIDEDNP